MGDGPQTAVACWAPEASEPGMAQGGCWLVGKTHWVREPHCDPLGHGRAQRWGVDAQGSPSCLGADRTGWWPPGTECVAWPVVATL